LSKTKDRRLRLTNRTSPIVKAIKDIDPELVRHWLNQPPQNTLKISDMMTSIIRKSLGTLMYIQEQSKDVQGIVQIALAFGIRAMPQQIIVDREERKFDFTELMKMWQQLKAIDTNDIKQLEDKGNNNEKVNI